MNWTGLLTVLIDGVTYGMLFFLFSIGLSITLGLMRFINLAHGAFAMMGGYLVVLLVGSLGMPFLLALPLCFALTGVFGAVLERLLIQHVYAKSELQHVLFSIGLAFAAGAIANILFGPQQQPIPLPDWAEAKVVLLGATTTGYRMFILAAGAAALALLMALFQRSLFGARVRAAVDRRRTAEGIGINVGRLFALTFGLGAACAGLGGGLAVGLLGLDPSFPLKYLVIVLMIVAIGGPGSILGSFLAALFLGVVDAVFKYYLPVAGSFVIYALLVLTMVFVPKGFMGRKS
ncbi:branched-chain amino acid transport system permease protein [Comamonas sp. BIGb0124]|uniref:branched-chain amino acid ABC transporter permease n=1 Tax=Comamonas sp. BIGb0124 TaxID=2485130 RepID=UPI000F4650C9|nr:branched-chain amino acid ABC transporter permease [Comamonas sp. BIGb0124]ROR23076.1 branched-chain amino acid transport system permease protein [Comamonas sp. BIGb0124]